MEWPCWNSFKQPVKMSEWSRFRRSGSLESSEFWRVCLFTCFNIWKSFLVDTDWCPGNARIVGTGSTNKKDNFMGNQCLLHLPAQLSSDKLFCHCYGGTWSDSKNCTSRWHLWKEILWKTGAKITGTSRRNTKLWNTIAETLKNYSRFRRTEIPSSQSADADNWQLQRAAHCPHDSKYMTSTDSFILTVPCETYLWCPILQVGTPKQRYLICLREMEAETPHQSKSKRPVTVSPAGDSDRVGRAGALLGAHAVSSLYAKHT